MSKVLVNNKFFLPEEAKISPFDRGFVYGDSVYEVILIYNGKLIFTREHCQRMVNSLQMMHIKGFDLEKLVSIVEEIHKENIETKYGFVYLQISRGIQFKRYGKLDGLKPTIIGYVEEMKPEDFYNDTKPSISCKIVKDPRRFQRNAKVNSLMPMVVAKYEANKEGFDDVIFEDRLTENITESSTSNLFIVTDDYKVLTHPNGSEILPGTTRAFLIDLFKQNNIEVVETFFKKENIYNAKEVFVTGAVKLIVPVVKVDDFIINSGNIGKITKLAQDRIIEFISK